MNRSAFVSEGSINMGRFSLDELLVGPGYDDQTGRLREEPSLAGYLVNQVIQGRSELVEGKTKVFISNHTMNVFEELVLREGGLSLEYQPRQHSEHPKTVMRLGRFLVTHRREVSGPSLALSAAKGPWGIPRTADFESEERAHLVFELIRRGLSFLPPQEGKVYDRAIESEWGVPVRIPVPLPSF
jgi:hypothetical protein